MSAQIDWTKTPRNAHERELFANLDPADQAKVRAAARAEFHSHTRAAAWSRALQKHRDGKL